MNKPFMDSDKKSKQPFQEKPMLGARPGRPVTFVPEKPFPGQAAAGEAKALVRKRITRPGEEEEERKPTFGDVREPLDEALEEVNRNLAQDPLNEDLHMRRFQILRKSGDREALATALEEVASFSTNPFFATRLAELYEESFNHTKALQWRSKAVEHKPDDPYAIKRLAFARIRTGDIEGAEDSFGMLLSVSGTDEDPLGHTFFQEMQGHEIPREKRAEVQQLGLKVARLALEKRPDNVPLLEGASRLARVAGDLKGSIAFYERLIKAGADHPNIRQWKTELLRVYARFGLPEKWRGLSEELLADYRRHLETHPNDSNGWSSFASLQIQAGLYEEALDSLRQAMAVDQANIQAIYEFGRLLVRMNRSDEALEYYHKILPPPGEQTERKSFHRALELCLADLFFKIGKYQESLDIYMRDEELNARFIGAVYEAMGDMDRAEKYYLRAIRNSPRDARSYLALSEYCTRIGDWERAIEKCREGLGCTFLPREALESLYVALATAQVKTGRVQEALETMEAAVESSPELLSMAFRRVKVLFFAGRSEEGKKAAEEVRVQAEAQLECAPASSGLWSLLGDCYSLLGYHNEAKHAYTMATRYDAMDAASVRGIGVLAERERKYAEAAKYYERFVLLDPLSLAAPPLREKIVQLRRVVS